MENVYTLPGVFPDTPNEVEEDDALDGEMTSPEKGAAAEAYVAYILSEWGILHTRVNWPATDLICLAGDRALRVEVKSTGGHFIESRGRTPTYVFHPRCDVRGKDPRIGQKIKVGSRALTPSDCDIIAYVARDINRVCFKLPSGKQSERIFTHQMKHPGLEETSWADCLQKLGIT